MNTLNRWSEKKAVKQETELGKILAEIVSSEANKLRTDRRDFYHRLARNGMSARGLVRALIKELETLFNENKSLARDVGRDISDVRVGKDNGTTQEYQQEIIDLKQDHASKIRGHEDRIHGLVEEVSRLERVVEDDKHALEINENEVQTLIYNNETQRREVQRAHEKEQSSLQAGHNAEKVRLQEALDAEKEALRRLREEHNAEEKRLRSRISELQKEHEFEKGQMEQEQKFEEDRMQKEHKSEEDRMQQEHQSEIDRMQGEHESNQARLRAKMARMKKEHDSEQKQTRREVDEEKARLKSDFKTMKAQLEEAHAAETKRLRRDIEAYSEDLLTRDDFKPMLDNEIKGRFLDLAQEIDTLARLEWKPNQKEWTNQVLRRLSGNQRLLKKQILQDSVWVILHENIFCSPFKVFGEEGQRLESQWNDKYEQDSQLDNGCYIWPKPSIDAERWRYATIKECRAALEKPVSEWDPWARLKKGFKTSLDALTQELTSTLGEVSNLDESSVQAAGSIIKKAAKMWLEFGMQRCRILVIVRGSNLKSAEERIQRAQEATLKLVLVPELKRFGNSKGQDVHIEETVGGCDGEMVEVSMSR